jgi:hypothetical protein
MLILGRQEPHLATLNLNEVALGTGHLHLDRRRKPGYNHLPVSQMPVGL